MPVRNAEPQYALTCINVRSTRPSMFFKGAFLPIRPLIDLSILEVSAEPNFHDPLVGCGSSGTSQGSV